MLQRLGNPRAPSLLPADLCLLEERGRKQRDHPFPSSSAGNFGAQHPAERSQAGAVTARSSSTEAGRGMGARGGSFFGYGVLIEAEMLSGEKGGGWSVGRWRKHVQGHGWR